MPNFVRSLAVVLAITLAVLIPQAAFAIPVADQSQAATSVGNTQSRCSTGPMASITSSGNAFTAGATGNLTSIDIPVISASTSEQALVSVYAAANEAPTGTAIATQPISTSQLTAVATGGTLQVVFATPASVVSGTGYAFVVSFPSCSSSVSVRFPIGLAAPGKHFVQRTGSSGPFIVDTTYAINFTTYVEAPAPQNTPSPTPSVSATPSVTSAAQLANTGSHHVELTLLWVSLGTLLLALGTVLFTRNIKRRVSAGTD